MSDWNADPQSSFELADRILRAWEQSLSQLASGYARALGEADAPREVARAA